MRQISLEFLRVTEAGAIAAAQHVGSGDKIAADQAAVNAMRKRLNSIDFAGKVVIGEGIKDGAPGLFSGEWVGKKSQAYKETPASASEAAEYAQKPSYYELAIDPIEGTTPVSKGGYEAISVLAIANENSLFSTSEYYMKKLVAGPHVCKRVSLSIDDPVERTLSLVSTATGKDKKKITVCVLDRPRHEKLVNRIRSVGCRIKFIQDCDVTGSIATCLPDSGIDLLMGIGGSPEGVIAASAMKCMGGAIQVQLCEKNGDLIDNRIYSTDNLIKGDTVFCATGITDGSFLDGVTYRRNKPVTHSVLMRSESGTIRHIEACHGN